jgi:hypothetical protein
MRGARSFPDVAAAVVFAGVGSSSERRLRLDNDDHSREDGRERPMTGSR